MKINNKTGEELISQLIKIVSFQLNVEFNLSSSFSDVLILDSSTEKKFSSHLIFPEIVFKNNQYCGNFVKRVMDKISKEECLEFSCIDSLNVKMIVDSSVYSVNQNFRILFSSKLGKKTTLKLSKINKFMKDADYQLFLDSLVCDKDFIVNTYSLDTESDSEPMSKKKK